MREEVTDFPTGVRWLTLFPETLDEARLTLFELELGNALLHGDTPDELAEPLLFAPPSARVPERWDDPHRIIAREQLRRATVQSREFTNVGFFINLLVPGDVARGDPSRLCTGLGRVPITVRGPGLSSCGAGAIFIANDGVIQAIECFTYGDDLWLPVAARDCIFGNAAYWIDGRGQAPPAGH